MDTANGPPKDSGKLVTMMKAGPRCFGIKSLAASEADVEDAGYSPPAPVNMSVNIDFGMECLARTYRILRCLGPQSSSRTYR